MENIYMTKNVYENLDLRIVAEVIHLLKRKIRKSSEENLDKFQVFEVENNKMIRRQEYPEEVEVHTLNDKFRKMNIWVVQGSDESQGRYWTIMFPEDY